MVGARHGSGALLAGALLAGVLTSGALATAELDAGAVASGEFIGLAGTADAALLPGGTEAIGGDEVAAPPVGCLAQAASSRTVRTAALVGVRTCPLAFTSRGRKDPRRGCTDRGAGRTDLPCRLGEV